MIEFSVNFKCDENGKTRHHTFEALLTITILRLTE